MSSAIEKENVLAFSLEHSILVDNNLYIPIPNGYITADYSFLSDYADSKVIVAEKFPMSEDPATAEWALIIQSRSIPCGMLYSPEKHAVYTELFTAYYPIFFETENVQCLQVAESCDILYQLSEVTETNICYKYHGLIIVKDTAYMFHLICNPHASTEKSVVNQNVFCEVAMKWLSMIMLPDVYTSKVEEHKRELEEQARIKAEQLELERQEAIRREEELRRQKEAIEKALREAEQLRQQMLQEEKQARYDTLVSASREQEQIISNNRGWFGTQAKRRKAAIKQLEEIQKQLAFEFPAGRP